MSIENQSTRLEQLLGISKKAEQKFIANDPFGVVIALIEAGISDIEYQEFLDINPHGWYDSNTRATLDEAILSRGINGSPMMLRTDCDWIIQINRKKTLDTIH